MPGEINKKFCKSASYYIQTCYLLHQPFFILFFCYGFVVDKTGAGYALDVFQKSKYSKDINELNAWLSLLTATTMDDLAVLISDYPWMEAICMDMSEYLYHPEEVVTMFSEALRKLDENTVNYMIDELKKERDEAVTALAERDATVSEMGAALSKKDAEIARLKAQLAERNK